ncbi:MAG TPA: hypothetical protein D7H93_00030 [Candidatus Poseidoniales archaeon]|nr:MAG TPA: hypothetical protein D7H93_00030 [Candidatus Poseidoniales archaeon]
MIFDGSSKSTFPFWAPISIGETDARMNIKTGSSAEANFRPPSCILPVMNVQQVPGVVMGYGGMPPKLMILSPSNHNQNKVMKWVFVIATSMKRGVCIK